MANADIVCRDIRMTGKGRTRVARTCGARPGVSLASAERGKAIGDSRNGYRRNALYAVIETVCATCFDGELRGEWQQHHPENRAKLLPGFGIDTLTLSQSLPNSSLLPSLSSR